MTSNDESSYTYGGIAVFRAVCESCGHSFEYPMLGDMLGYGEFIASTDRGGRYAYVSAFTGEWDEITHILDEVAPARKSEDPEGTRLQHVIGQSLDPMDGRELTIIDKPICPKCQSRDVTYGTSERLGFLKVPDAKWNRFKSLSESEKHQLISRLWTESKNFAEKFRLDRAILGKKALERHRRKMNDRE